MLGQRFAVHDAEQIKKHPDGVSSGVVDAIMAAIQSGIMVPGQHLLEAELSIRFGVSRHSLRPALHRLAADGVVRLDRYRGAYLNVYDRQTALDLLDAVGPLICLAVELSVRNVAAITTEQRAFLAGADAGDVVPDARSASFLMWRHRFYWTIFELSNNRQLAGIIPFARIDLLRAQMSIGAEPGAGAEDMADYQDIARAVLNADVESATAAAKRHIANRRRTVEAAPGICFRPLSGLGV